MGKSRTFEGDPIRSSLSQHIRVIARRAGLDVVGFSRAKPYSETAQVIEERKKAGLFGKLGFTTREPWISCDPAASLRGVRSIITCGLYYYCDPPPKPFSTAARIASYARRDFYTELRKGLEAVAVALRERGFEAVVMADSNRLTDRPPAVEAGLGRYGKNSMVITHTHGSWVLLGSVLTTAELPEGSPSKPDCGPCRACMVRCPTGAIVAEGVIDARRCIAYLLQASGPIPEEFRGAVGDRLYGCDDCQSCCPLNKETSMQDDSAKHQHVRALSEESVQAATYEDFWVDARWVLRASTQVLKERFGHFYVPRRDFDYLRRNALVVLGNCGGQGDLKAVEAFKGSPKRLLREHAEWAVRQIRRRLSQAHVVS